MHVSTFAGVNQGMLHAFDVDSAATGTQESKTYLLANFLGQKPENVILLFFSVRVPSTHRQTNSVGNGEQEQRDVRRKKKMKKHHRKMMNLMFP